MLSQNLRSHEVAFPAPRLPGNAFRRNLVPNLVGDRLNKPFDHRRVPLPKQIGQIALEPDQNIGDQIRNNEFDLRRGRGVDHAAFEDQTPQPELALARVSYEFVEGFGWGDVEDQLVLEGVEDDDDEPSDAAEAEGVEPEPPGLHLPGPGTDVDGLGPFRAAPGRGEEPEPESEVFRDRAVEGERGEDQRWRLEDGLSAEGGGGGCCCGGAEEMGSETERQASRHWVSLQREELF
ncbi:hypothetical protein PanWU01x14_129720, partial [Parasponia andersonii]